MTTTLTVDKIYRHPCQVSECWVEDWRCKMAGMTIHLSPSTQTCSLCIQITRKAGGKRYSDTKITKTINEIIHFPNVQQIYFISRHYHILILMSENVVIAPFMRSWTNPNVYRSSYSTPCKHLGHVSKIKPVHWVSVESEMQSRLKRTGSLSIIHGAKWNGAVSPVIARWCWAS